MEISDIPFVQHSGVVNLKENVLMLEYQDERSNHLQTIHAGALYTLAESQSGLFLSYRFPAFEGSVVPLLREGSMKYKKPVKDYVYAVADASEDTLKVFERIFLKKGKGSIKVKVLLKNEDDEVCAVGTFNWFVQKRGKLTNR